LTLASNDHGHTGEPRGWDQSKVSVEIESMGNRDPIPPQVMGKPQARPKRVQAKQAAAKGKFWHPAEVIEKCSTPPNATWLDVERRWIQRLSQRYKLALAATSFETVGHQEQFRNRISRMKMLCAPLRIRATVAFVFVSVHPPSRKEAA
jgi:hypothetical protein